MKMVTTLANHPLIAHHLSALRSQSTTSGEFRLLLQRLAYLLVFEASKDLTLVETEIETPVATTNTHRLNQRIGLTPILRAGLGMVEPVLDLLPDAEVWHLGMYRDEETSKPVEYYSRLPEDCPIDVAFILDPMLATGGSAILAIESLKKWGVPSIKVLSIIASKWGLEQVQESFNDVEMICAAIDPELNDQNFIIPGLGDAGDRIFNT